jgi:hypothetical protein
MATRGGAGWARRPAPAPDPEDTIALQALDALITARLVVANDDHIEITHDALFAHWPRLRDWLDERTLAADLLQHLDQTATTWRAGGRQDTDLYRGPRLAAALDWRAEHTRRISPRPRTNSSTPRPAPPAPNSRRSDVGDANCAGSPSPSPQSRCLLSSAACSP